MIEFDDRDQEIVVERMTELDARTGIRVGDFLRYRDGTLARVAYVWDDSVQPASVAVGRHPAHWSLNRYAPGVGGSYYLGDGYVSYSGSLHRGVSRDLLELTDATELGAVWIFHHGWSGAHRGVDTKVAFRVWSVDADADAD